MFSHRNFLTGFILMCNQSTWPWRLVSEQSDELGAAELKQKVIFLVIDHMTVSHIVRISPCVQCICNYAYKLLKMDVIGCSDMSD